MSEFTPTLVLIIPEHHEIDPDAVDELRHYLRHTYSADLSVVRSLERRESIVPLYDGPWRWDGPVPLHDDLWPRVQQTTFTLDWLHGVH